LSLTKSTCGQLGISECGPGLLSSSQDNKHITWGAQEVPQLVDGGERRDAGIMEEVEEFDLADLMSETIGGDPKLKTEL
jgi:hypothetical protein